MDNHDVEAGEQAVSLSKSETAIDEDVPVARSTRGQSLVPASQQTDFADFQSPDSSAGMMRSINKLEAELVNLRLVYEHGLEEARLDGPKVTCFDSDTRFPSDIELKEFDSTSRTTPMITTVKRASAGDSISLVAQDFESITQQNDTLKRICESEQTQRLETEAINERLRQRIRRDTVSYQQQKQELLDNLHLAMTNITSLEAKVSELSGFEHSLPELLTKMHEVAEQELLRYHEDSQEMIERNVTQLQSHVNDDVIKIFELSKENRQLHSTTGELNNLVQKLERQVDTAQQEKEALEHLLERERRISQAYISRLEEKLAHLRVMIVDKLKELQEAREARLPLVAEVDAFRVLLGNIEDARRKAQLLQDVKQVKECDAAEKVAAVPVKEHISEQSLVSTTGPGPISANPVGPGPISISPVGPVSRNGSVAPVGPIERPTSGTMSHASVKEGSSRVRSAPVTASNQHSSAGQEPIGYCRDYFDAIFESSSTRELGRSVSNHELDEREVEPKPESVRQHDYTTASSSAIGNVQINEIHPKGLFISLTNTSATDTEEIGEYKLQQNVGGFPVAAFRFPARVRFPPGKTLTVWSGKNDPLLHQPPFDFVFTEQQYWGTGPECTTILCKPNGQAVAWMTAAHRFTSDAYRERSDTYIQTGPTQMGGMNLHSHGCIADSVNPDEPKLTQYDLNTIGSAASTPSTLRREKTPQPSLLPQRHPHGVSPPTPTHPHTGQARPMTYGNDNSSLQRQSRSQSTRPDPVPGAPYAGASAQRMGSAMLRTFRPKSSNRPRTTCGLTSGRPPSSFERPHSRFNSGLQQIQSQHNFNFQPAMPRPYASLN